MFNPAIKPMVDSELYKYENLIIEFAIENYPFEWKSDIQIHILTYLFIHETLTQQEIKDLSEIFYKKGSKEGFSSGSISSYLNELLDLSVVKQKKIKTNQVLISPRSVSKFYLWQFSNVYFLNPRFLNIPGFHSPEIIDKNLRRAKNFYTEKMRNLEELRVRNINKNSVKNTLLERLREMIEYIDYRLESHKESMSKFPIEKKKEYIAIEEYRKNLERFQEVGKNKSEAVENDNISKRYPYRLKIEEIEKDLINFTINSPMFAASNPQYSEIIAYLIFRKELTQQKIKELTGFSAGMISQGLNYLIKEGLIRRKKIKGVREKLYIMDSIAFSNFLWIYKKLKILEKWDPIINKTMDELKKRENEISHRNGYKQIKKCLEYLNQSISANQYFMEAIKEEIIKVNP